MRGILKHVRQWHLAAASLSIIGLVAAVVWAGAVSAPKSQRAASSTNQVVASISQQAATATSPAAAAQARSTLPTTSRPTPDHLGLFVSDSPSDPAKATATLDWAAATGFDVLYNYASFDGTPDQVQAYLDAAAVRHIHIIFSLKDLYDALPEGASTAATFSAWGSSNEQIAQSVVKAVAGHPATYGFALTDEQPEQPSDLATWQPILATRYAQIKLLTSKPVISVLVGWTSSSAADRQSFLMALRSSSDHFALDYYPVPFEDQSHIGQIAQDATVAGDTDSWFIEQAFSWASYPATATGLGHSPAAARYPSADEMVAMGRAALSGGARSLLFYSYFDVSSSPSQLVALRTAVLRLRSGN